MRATRVWAAQVGADGMPGPSQGGLDRAGHRCRGQSKALRGALAARSGHMRAGGREAMLSWFRPHGSRGTYRLVEENCRRTGFEWPADGR
jgi:hypothetical protein